MPIDKQQMIDRLVEQWIFLSEVRGQLSPIDNAETERRLAEIEENTKPDRVDLFHIQRDSRKGYSKKAHYQ